MKFIFALLILMGACTWQDGIQHLKYLKEDCGIMQKRLEEIGPVLEKPGSIDEKIIECKKAGFWK
jgi:hypothetical protein